MNGTWDMNEASVKTKSEFLPPDILQQESMLPTGSLGSISLGAAV